ncbi:hypothetical protein [Zavarzinia sp.]|uniref:hypothetical protein n=1 Tax=Zavarzinia sp. TaxID=2027920 RepID=UPI00356ADBA3
MDGDPQSAVALTLRRIDIMQREVQASVLETMMRVNEEFLEHQLRHEELALVNEIARELKAGLSFAAEVADHLKTSAKAGPVAVNERVHAR